MDGNNWRPATQGESSGIDNGWRNQLTSDARKKIVNKIMETLQKHLPVSGPEGLVELQKIAVRFEEKIYTAATSQVDYLRKISMKMLSLENKPQRGPPNTLLSTVVDMAHNRRVSIGRSASPDRVIPQSSSLQPFSFRQRHQWTPPQDRKLVEILLWNLHSRTIDVNKIKDIVYQTIANELSNVFEVPISPLNVRNRIVTLRKTYEMYRHVLNKTGMGWNAIEYRFAGPSHAWTALIAQDKKYKRLKRPQHLNCDELYELFGGNHATGEYEMEFEHRTHEVPQGGNDSENGEGIGLENAQTEEPACESSGDFATPGSSSTAMGGSSSHSNVPSHATGLSPDSFGRVAARSVRR